MSVTKIQVISKEFCVQCGKDKNVHKHHILYEPEMTAFLCYHCHLQVTVVNTVFARFFGTKLTNELRLKIWEIFRALPNSGLSLFKKQA